MIIEQVKDILSIFWKLDTKNNLKMH